VLSFVGPLLSLVLSGLFYLAMLAVEPGTVPGALLRGPPPRCGPSRTEPPGVHHPAYPRGL
ncbi:hypothetical protein, partial [Streptomyces mirabilis]|uniref:hypothetical protein n=1 Tax=Streptomyces mirabilis TaxID=68239 RepID=UPI0033EFB7A9